MKTLILHTTVVLIVALVFTGVASVAGGENIPDNPAMLESIILPGFSAYWGWNNTDSGGANGWVMSQLINHNIESAGWRFWASDSDAGKFSLTLITYGTLLNDDEILTPRKPVSNQTKFNWSGSKLFDCVSLQYFHYDEKPVGFPQDNITVSGSFSLTNAVLTGSFLDYNEQADWRDESKTSWSANYRFEGRFLNSTSVESVSLPEPSAMVMLITACILLSGLIYHCRK